MAHSKITGYFLSLLKASLDTRQPIPSEKLTADEWAQIFEMSKKQNMTALLSAGIERLDLEVLPPRLILLQWLVANECVRKRNIVMNRASAGIQSRLAKDGFASCLLKGQGVASYYPDPYKRIPGDIDLWVDCNRHDFIAYITERFPNPDIKYRDIDVLISKDIEAEFHFTPAVFNNYFNNARLQEYFRSNKSLQFRNYVVLSTGGEKVCTPTNDFNRIYLLVHLFNHYLYEGIGLRQFVDYYFLLKQGFTQKEKENNIQTLRELSLMKFTAATMYILKECLGLENNLLLTEPNADEGKQLLNCILQGGNFGKYDPRNEARITYSLATFCRHMSRNTHYVKSYPGEVLSSPFFKLWHYCYRKANRYI